MKENRPMVRKSQKIENRKWKTEDRNPQITNHQSQIANLKWPAGPMLQPKMANPKIVNRQSSIGNVDWRFTGKGAAASGDHFHGGNPGKVNFGIREEDYEQSTF
jgi:hypothetical protein